MAKRDHKLDSYRITAFGYPKLQASAQPFSRDEAVMSVPPIPSHPPVDGFQNLSILDVEACIWFAWQRDQRNMAAYPAVPDLMKVTLKVSFPPRPWGVAPDVDMPAKLLFRDIQNALEAYTLHRANLAFSAFVKAFESDKTWGELAAQLHAKAIYVAGLRRARALKALR